MFFGACIIATVLADCEIHWFSAFDDITSTFLQSRSQGPFKLVLLVRSQNAGNSMHVRVRITHLRSNDNISEHPIDMEAVPDKWVQFNCTVNCNYTFW